MIIKTINHPFKFGKLYNYITNRAKQENDFTFYHNLSSGVSRESVLKDFIINDKYRKRVKTKAVHEIISWKKGEHLTDQQLLKICEKYIQIRAPEALVYGKVHREEHIHLHLMLSGNKFHQDRSIRLSKKDFMRIRREIECFQHEELKIDHSMVYTGKENLRQRKVYELTEKPTPKNTLVRHARECAEKARNMREFVELIEAHSEMTVYSRENQKNYGVIYKGKKWRINRLVESHQLELLQRLDMLDQIRQEKQQQKQEKKLKLNIKR